ncbi:glutamate-cysteine ligase family protein [Kribbella sp. NPDC003505]|uniref:glutamate-cysteine ligase family protein n=1 Tax=Kribbella sp. NPDC003505 TaxID=3154448 RepID=UPI0033B4247B
MASESVSSAATGRLRSPARRRGPCIPAARRGCSPPPSPCWGSSRAFAALRAEVEGVRAAVAGLGIGLVEVGADPLRPSYRTNPSARYRAMEQYFAATGAVGPGAVTMNSTAALQVNLEAGLRREWARWVAQAHRLGPVLLAVSATSPWLHGRSTGWKSARQRAWLQLDRRRTGPVLDVFPPVRLRGYLELRFLTRRHSAGGRASWPSPRP